MLEYRSHERFQILGDDMDSLLYVVIYCSMLWLPHDTSKEVLEVAIRMMFEQEEFFIDRWYGGQGKTLDAHTRQFTGEFDWKSPGLGEWINTALDYSRPPRERIAELYDRWDNPQYLDDYWGEFLRTHELERNDRVVHDHPRSTGQPRVHCPSSNSTEALSFKVEKRASINGTDVAGIPTNKRSRVAVTAVVAAPPRRSQRILERKEVAPPQPAVKQSSTRTTRRTSRATRRQSRK